MPEEATVTWAAGGRKPRSQVAVLVVDDDKATRRVVADAFREEGDAFAVEEAADGRLALELLDAWRPDVVILDVVLPEMGGIDVLKEMRRRSNVPVILLTGRRAEADRVVGLELGADDYVVKPFSVRELVARVRTVMRRVRGPASTAALRFPGLTVDPATRAVLVDGEPVELTAKEFDLLAYLASSPRQVFGREQLLHAVWDSSEDWQSPATVTEHIRRIRLKIERDPLVPAWITTARGVGYRFESGA